MARTSESEVRDIYSPHVDGTALNSTAVQFYIDAASALVDEHLGGSNVSSGQLQRIEALLACHYLAAGDPTELSFGESDAQGEFEAPSTIPADLGETRFGRRALTLDPTGNLARIPSGDVSKAEFFGPT